MNIKLTPEAKRTLKESLGNRPGTVRLIYDTEGCGCAVNGVPGLQIVDAPSHEDAGVATDGSVAMVIRRKHEVFFEEQLKLDVQPGTATYRLTSRNQTYGTHIRVADARA